MNKRLWLLVFIHCLRFIKVYGAENNTDLDESDNCYLIGCDVAVSKIPDNDIPNFESALGKLFCLVFERATHERLGQSVMRMSRAFNFSSELCKVETIENKALGSHSKLIFTVSYDGSLVDAAVATKEISRLSLSHLSASLTYPIVSIYAVNYPERSSNVQYWLILIIIGCCLLICVFGWLILFVYYNTCALPMRQYRSYSTESRPNIEPTPENKNPVQTKIDEPVNLIGMKKKSDDNISTETILSGDQITAIPDIKPRDPEPLSNKESKNENDEKNVVYSKEDPKFVPDPEHGVKSLKKEDVSKNEQNLLKEIPIPDPWNPYYAGDRVEAIRLGEPRQHYPQPAFPTQEGVLSLKTME